MELGFRDWADIFYVAAAEETSGNLPYGPMAQVVNLLTEPLYDSTPFGKICDSTVVLDAPCIRFKDAEALETIFSFDTDILTPAGDPLIDWVDVVCGIVVKSTFEDTALIIRIQGIERVESESTSICRRIGILEAQLSGHQFQEIEVKCQKETL
jgi:hypothetical protein